jgi:hypothetical protein
LRLSSGDERTAESFDVADVADDTAVDVAADVVRTSPSLREDERLDGDGDNTLRDGILLPDTGEGRKDGWMGGCVQL